MFENILIILFIICVSSVITFAIWLWRSAYKDRYDWCDCGRFNLKDVDHKKTRNRVHRRNVCCPVRETIF